ncbi:MAG: alpha/beta hydrolase [Candidatus Methanofastidiosa archaeon]|nr:alpha/beta hydrolase [Candidatus Methanofastidiosa archaeon]
MKQISLLLIVIISFIFRVQAQEREIITSDSVKLYVKVKGTGTPCLYIHGGPGSGSYWLEKFFGDFLEQHFQMIYLDQRGVSRSSSPKDKNYSLDRMIQDFEEVRGALGIKEWLTLGHSFGGILQMAYIEKYPQSVKGMIMINCTLNMKESFCNSWIPKAAEFAGVNYTLPQIDSPDAILNTMMEVSKAMDEKMVMWKMAYSSQRNDSLMNSSYMEIPNWNNDFSSVALSIKDYWNDYKAETSKIKIPVLFFYGHTDWMVGPKHFVNVKFPNMIVWGSDVGHMPFLENRDDLERAIDKYIMKYNF